MVFSVYDLAEADALTARSCEPLMNGQSVFHVKWGSIMKPELPVRKGRAVMAFLGLQLLASLSKQSKSPCSHSRSPFDWPSAMEV